MLTALITAAVLNTAALPAMPVPAGPIAPAGTVVAAPTAQPPSVNEADLGDMRGGFSTPTGAMPTAFNSALSSQDLSGLVSGNSVTAGTVNSGMISFDGQSLSGFTGIGNFLLNTGVNSLLQGAVNVTVNLAPATGR